jgi:hypothetical protein
MADASFGGAVTLGLEGPGGSLNGNTSVAAENGVAVFDGLSISGAGTFTLRATAPGLEAAESSPFTSVRVDEILVPRYMQADRPNDDRVPYAFRLRLSGLEPHATYRYANRIATVDEPPRQDGAGNNIFVDPLEFRRNTNTPDFGGDPETYSTFQADSAGMHEGWFITEPTGNDRFDEAELHLRIILNDGAGGEDNHFILNTASTAELRRFGESPEQATGFHGAAPFEPRNFVFLYDSVEGAGRPLAGTFVEPGGQEVDGRYVTFYEEEVFANEGRWGGLLPNDLSNGVQRIEERAFADGALVGVYTSEDGVLGRCVDGQPHGRQGESHCIGLRWRAFASAG